MTYEEVCLEESKAKIILLESRLAVAEKKLKIALEAIKAAEELCNHYDRRAQEDGFNPSNMRNGALYGAGSAATDIRRGLREAIRGVAALDPKEGE